MWPQRQDPTEELQRQNAGSGDPVSSSSFATFPPLYAAMAPSSSAAAPTTTTTLFPLTWLWDLTFFGTSQTSSISSTSSSTSSTSRLSAFDDWKCRVYGRNALSWWKVETLTHALSAMRAAPDFYCVRCPPRCGHRAGYFRGSCGKKCIHDIWHGSLLEAPLGKTSRGSGSPPPFDILDC